MVLLKNLWPLALSLVLVLLVLALLLRLLESWMTFYPGGTLEANPADYGLAHENMLFDCADGGTIHGWYFPPADQEAPVLIIFHGNAGNISHRLDWIAPLVNSGTGALLFDYRGYGKSRGASPSEKTFRQDAETVYEHLKLSRGLETKRLIPFGRSLGSYPAAWLAAHHPVGGLILEGAFGSGKQMARQMFGFLPAHLVMKNRWEVAGNLARAGAPALIVHGTADNVVPFILGAGLAKTERQAATEWWPVQGGSHLDLHLVLGEKYYQRLREFARSAASRGGRKP
ncbi:MAG: alpha/beta hydrolase [Gemmatimonadota bacterium]|nr:alpha/beta hydrolase [Gemmatimonadota bacterium]